jgi:MinD-like ATPase involved in chromosome partitioning or flagellar assembly
VDQFLILLKADDQYKEKIDLLLKVIEIYLDSIYVGSVDELYVIIKIENVENIILSLLDKFPKYTKIYDTQHDIVVVDCSPVISKEEFENSLKEKLNKTVVWRLSDFK